LRARQERPGDVRPATELARIALFASDVDGANRAIEALSTSASAHPAVRRTHAAIDVLRARHEAAAAALEGVIRDDPTDSEAFTWLAEARLRLGRWDGVYDALHRATMTSNGYLLPAWILRSLAHMLSGDDGDNRFRPRRFEALLWSMDSLFEGGRAELESRDKSRITAALERGLSTLGGNRTPYSSKLVDGRLTGLLPGTSPRHASRRALQLIRSADPERVFAALDEVVQRFPTSSLPVAHRGELALWLGDLKRARADLERAIEIDEGTRWAWIGLTGIETLEGHPDKALEVSARGVQVMKGTVGASVYAYRADAYAALGRFDEAIADLETSARLSKTRLGATVALASLLDMRGDAERAAEIFDQLVDEAPGLLSDAARDEGIVLFETRRPNPTADERQRVMRRALALLGGNRSSSCVTYRTSKGVLRMVPGPSGSRPHRGADEDDLARVRTLLLRATG
jgi:tetratricopeptide (TPR) repeat protein